jgi:hypothetical protein
MYKGEQYGQMWPFYARSGTPFFYKMMQVVLAPHSKTAF